MDAGKADTKNLSTDGYIWLWDFSLQNFFSPLLLEGMSSDREGEEWEPADQNCCPRLCT